MEQLTSEQQERMERRRQQHAGMGDVAYERGVAPAASPSPRPSPRPVLRGAFQQHQNQHPQQAGYEGDEGANEQPSLREMIADFLPTALRIVGVMIVLYSGFATVLFMYQIAGQFFQQAVIQGIIGVVVAVGIFFGQAVAVSTPDKVGRDVYVVLLIFDSVFTAAMAHTFTMSIVSAYPWLPVALMASTTFIGFRVTQRKWTTFKIAMISIGLAAFMFIGQMAALNSGNMQAFEIILWVVDLIGAVWASRLGEEAALGRRLVW